MARTVPSVALAALIVCLSFTDARADTTRSRWGTNLRLGTVAGVTAMGGEEVTSIGVQLGLGYKLGPISLEAQWDGIDLLVKNEGLERGSLSRIGVNGRLFLPRVGKRFEPTTVLLFFVEGGVGRERGALDERRFTRLDSSVGGGFILDHRVKDANSSLFNYVGWHFGWAFRGSERGTHLGPSALAACKKESGTCKPPAPIDDDDDPTYDIGLLVSSSITFSW